MSCAGSRRFCRTQLLSGGAVPGGGEHLGGGALSGGGGRPPVRRSGDIPWVVVDSALGDERTDAQKALDAWVDAHFEPLDTVRGQTLVARVYALPRGGRP